MDTDLESLIPLLGLPPGKIGVTKLAGDASARQFYRLTLPPGREPSSLVLAIFPPGEEAGADRYARMARSMREAGVAVPEIHHEDAERGYVLMEDCGNVLLQKAAGLLPGKAGDLIRQAIERILLMQEELTPESVPDCPAWEIAFDEEKFLRELDFFLKHTLGGYFAAPLPPVEREKLRDGFRVICRRCLSQPFVFCHRDYHSRNLLVRDGRLMIVDFQDARRGPYTYDLVSLLLDPYLELPAGARGELASYYFDRRPAFLRSILREQFETDCATMGIQRLLKAAGTYGYMFQEKGKKLYLPYLPKALFRCLEILKKYPEFDSLSAVLGRYH